MTNYCCSITRFQAFIPSGSRQVHPVPSPGLPGLLSTFEGGNSIIQAKSPNLFDKKAQKLYDLPNLGNSVRGRVKTLRKVLERCPTCESPLKVTRMECDHCGTTVESEYEPCPFCRLGPEESSFLQMFVKARGNIKEVQRELGVSYSAARAMLDTLLEAMGYDPSLTRELGPSPTTKEVLRALAEGRITRAQAYHLLGGDL